MLLDLLVYAIGNLELAFEIWKDYWIFYLINMFLNKILKVLPKKMSNNIKSSIIILFFI